MIGTMKHSSHGTVGKLNPMAMIAQCYLRGQRTIPDALGPEVMADIAESAASAVRDIDGLDLGFTPVGLAILDQILNRFHQAGDSAASIPQTLLMFGAFAGEVLIRNHGGNWAYRGDTTLAGTPGPSLVVELPNGTVCDPIGKVLEIVEDASDSLLFFYAMTAMG